jgi:hypothetical protein
VYAGHESCLSRHFVSGIDVMYTRSMHVSPNMSQVSEKDDRTNGSFGSFGKPSFGKLVIIVLRVFVVNSITRKPFESSRARETPYLQSSVLSF